MDVNQITFGDGLALTSDKLEDSFDIVTNHQITRQDLATSFAWGMDLVVGAGGILQAQHLNGTIADARYFRTGDDSAAIAAAVNYVANSTEGQGAVLIPAISGSWDIDTQITLPPNIDIIGVGQPTLNLSANVYAFLCSGVGAVPAGHQTISGLKLTGATGKGLVEAGWSFGTESLTITDCVISSSALTGYGILDMETNLSDARDILVTNNLVDEGNPEAVWIKQYGGFIGEGVVISGNRIYGKGRRAATYVFHIQGCPGVLVDNNFIDLDTYETSTLGGQAIYLASSIRSRVTNNTVIGGTDESVELSSSDHCRVAGNTLKNAGAQRAAGNANAQIELNSSNDCVIENNEASSDPGIAAVACDYGIYIAATCSRTIVRNNILEDLGVAAGQHQQALAGIRDLSATTVRSGNQVVANHTVQGAAAMAAGLNTETFNGLRDAGTDAVRNAQYIAFHVTTVSATASSQTNVHTTPVAAVDLIQLFTTTPNAADYVWVTLVA